MAEITVPRIDFSALGDLPNVYRKAQEQSAQVKVREARKQTLAELGQGGDLNEAARKLLSVGDIQGATTLANLGRDQRDFQFRKDESQRAQSNADRTYNLQEKALTNRSDTVTGQVEQRRRAAQSMGFDPSKPGYESYILTGKMPREDQLPLTATDKKAILEADEGVLAGENAIEGLKQAKKLSPTAFAGPMAGERGYVTSLFGNEGGEKTVELQNLITSNALTQLKSIFGGMPTEGERKILLEVQGSVSQPDAVRQKIYDRAIVAANKRLEFNRQRAASMRGGTFYRQQGQPQQGAPTQQAPQGGARQIGSKAEFDALPSGTQFVAPDGSVRIKP